MKWQMMMKKPKVSEKHEMANADSTNVPPSFLKKWYKDPRRKAIGASGKNVSIRVGATSSPAYNENYDKVFSKKPGEIIPQVELTRFDTTDEEIGARLVFGETTSEQANAEIVVYAGDECDIALTKWMDSEAVNDYHQAIHNGLLMMRSELKNEPHSRRLVIKGPPGACWISTQFLSNKYGGYTLIANYRSMEAAHADFDAALQFAIGKYAGVEVNKVILLIGSLHSYR